MNSKEDIDLLIERIADAIRGVSAGTLSDSRARERARELAARYRALERASVSEQSRGFVKGVLHHHNRKNAASLTGLCVRNTDSVAPLLFVGDRLLLAAAEELLAERKTADIVLTERLSIGGEPGRGFFLVFREYRIHSASLIVLSVSSSPKFSITAFERTAEILRFIYETRAFFEHPFVLDFSRTISTAVGQITHDDVDGSLVADVYRLTVPPTAFSGIGMYSLIDFSRGIVRSLKRTYGEGNAFFALSPTVYCVIAPAEKAQTIGKESVPIDLEGTAIPYRVERHILDSPRALSLLFDSM